MYQRAVIQIAAQGQLAHVHVDELLLIGVAVERSRKLIFTVEAAQLVAGAIFGM